MAKLLMKLRQVPEDEAQAVRSLLEEHGIEYYETSAGTWQTSVPGLWIRDDSQLDRAVELLNDYQQERSRTARAAYLEQKARGEHRTFLSNLRDRPVLVSVQVLLILLVLYLSLRVFLTL